MLGCVLSARPTNRSVTAINQEHDIVLNNSIHSHFLNQWWPGWLTCIYASPGLNDQLLIVLMPSRSLGNAWWRHQMETFSALLILCTGNSPMTGDFTAQKPVTRNFDIFLLCWVNNRDAGDLRRHRAHYDVTVMTRMWCLSLCSSVTAYNITFPFGTFIKTCMLCKTDWYWSAAYSYM